MNALENLGAVFESGDNEIHIDPQIARRALVPLQRMLEFSGGPTGRLIQDSSISRIS